MNIFKCLIISFVIVVAKRTYNSPNEYWVYWKNIKCECSDYCVKKYLYNMSCWINGKLYYKYGTIYREVMQFPKFNVCEVKKIFNSNPMLKLAYDIVMEYVPDIIKDCPY
ncbi:hypothetical protein PVAND_016610 [Polypedilum vanderplanki]|uniref:Uncharacterized protein n=1 Tax=Polypedilum vanderplanki TaxID=319348 RepID=A0A9J6BFL1_POLVA|nr:hypothetical protein PVAND_016610 [Polypedilum vanderplanki]